MSLTKVSYSMIQGVPISVLDYGADPTGVADSTAAIAAAYAKVISDVASYSLVFPTGTYRYSASPNFGVTALNVYGIGQVKLNYTGTDNALIFDAGTTAYVFNACFLGEFIVDAPITAKNGIYLRSVHHSKIQARIVGCGPTYSGLETHFSVCTEFWVDVTNTGAFGANQPLLGYKLGAREAAEQTSACTFYNPIVEGVSTNGIELTSAAQCQFIGGTSEGHNTGYGIYVMAASTRNTFHGIDCEANANGFIDYGNYNSYIGCLFADSSSNYGTNNTHVAGQYGGITNNGSMSLTGVSYTGLSGSGKTAKNTVYNITAGYFEEDLTVNSLQNTVNSVASGVATTIVTLPSARSRFFNVYANIPGTGNATAYRAIATVYQDLTASSIVSQTNGSGLTITLSGQNIQVTQTSGSAQTIQVIAQAL